MSDPTLDPDSTLDSLPFHPGTLIHGTLRVEDLLPDLLSELMSLDPGMVDAMAVDIEFVNTYLPTLDVQSPEKAEQMNQILVDVMDSLDEVASRYGYRFGSHEGDGADFGFWSNEQLELT